MSLEKAIKHGKEHRKQYRGAKSFDKAVDPMEEAESILASGVKTVDYFRQSDGNRLRREIMEMKYPNKLHEIRKSRGWTWKQMSTLFFGKMSNHIYETADGKRLVSMETLPTIEDVTGMSWREIWAEWLEKRERESSSSL